MTISIRDARAEDAVAIRALVHSESLDPTSLDWRHFVVAEESGHGDAAPRMVAIGQVKVLPGGFRELGSLVVVASHRGRGLVGLVIRTLEDKASRPLYLLCETKNQGLYAHYGYAPLRLRQAPFPLLIKWLVPTVLWGWRGYTFRLMVKR
jgi:N-acetylglutamate synthase-like GNAT family acetyltransferase